MKLKDYYKEKNYIHYSNCHEDFLLLNNYFKDSYKEVLSVASGLDNSLSFLVYDQVQVHSFDFNPVQIYLGKLKICGIQNLSYEEFLEFLGIKEKENSANINESNRLNLYSKIRDFLEEEVGNYFDNHIFLIKTGLVNAGRFEQYFHLFRKKVFPMVCNEKDIQEFAAAESIELQREIYKRKINTIRFKLMFKIFFSKTLMAKFGRDKSFFKYSKENLPKILKKKVDYGFNNCLNLKNPYYSYVLSNKYTQLPFYLEEYNFEKIKKNIKNITLENKTFDEMLNQKYDFMNLSDIFEYMSEEKMDNYSKEIANFLNKSGRVAFWNMMNVRKLTELNRIDTKKDYQMDRAFFYRDFLVYEK